MSIEGRKDCVGAAGFPALLLDRLLITRADLELAEQHAARERMPLADAVVALGLVQEADSYAMLAEAGGFEVDGDSVASANGKQAVEIAMRERPDLMIVDLNMPEMDGYEAITRLRREITMATLPIMVLTSEEGPGVERRVLELGADDYILKPFDPAVLLSRVNGVFRRLKVMAA